MTKKMKMTKTMIETTLLFLHHKYTVTANYNADETMMKS